MTNDKIMFAKTHENAVIPTKRTEDGAFDIYGIFDTPTCVVLPHQTVMIPTGLISAFSPKYVAILKERGSTGTKGMGQRSGVIDSGYRGEWMIPITNHNDYPMIFSADATEVQLKLGDANFVLDGIVRYDNVLIYPQSKAITQCVMVEVPALAIEEVTPEEVSAISSERGMGAWGSTGK